MIKHILIITIIAVLVPTAMSSVSASSESKIALFSTALSDSNGLSITGNGDSAKMELKATNDNGKSNRVAGFQLTADNVLSIEAGDKASVEDNVDFTKAVVTDAKNNQKAIGITSSGVIDFAGYTQGVYTLDVVVDDNRAYEAIIAIGDQTDQIVDKEITRVNSDYTLKFIIDYDCDKGYHYENGKCVPNKPKPIECDEYEKLIDGKCEKIYCIPEKRYNPETGNCEWIPGFEPIVGPEPPIPCDEGFEREGDECVPMPDTCMGGGPGIDGCPPVEPEPIECGEGEESVDGQCQPIDPLLIGDEDDNSDDQSIIGDDDSDESEDDEGEESGGSDDEGDEDSGGDDSEGSEESGGNEGETFA